MFLNNETLYQVLLFLYLPAILQKKYACTNVDVSIK